MAISEGTMGAFLLQRSMLVGWRQETATAQPWVSFLQEILLAQSERVRRLIV